ncbi:SDR family NAD(P)-dependent oxidoreductase [Paenibacillus thermotolerans]|uniref:SDR family NAD(P)-dependent oxidoreductase n=1 Tax=Paenibacillus thermotolerans TaxID=3027807 RepID=UPI0023680AFC|nr:MULTISPECIES: glucose 1-dehydrogenase [unclassified Paenibacillus]
MKLADRVALVTGGSRGIGAGICKELAKEGAIVAVNYTSHAAQANEVAGALRKEGYLAAPFRADVSNKQEVDRMIDEVVQTYGRIDILVNNAGICPFADFFDIDEATWRKTIDVNLAGAFFCSQAAGRYMRDQGKGTIIHIGTVTAFRGGKEQVHYAASKGGLNSLTSSMAVALGPYGIRVNGILCGGVPTDINKHQFAPGTHVPKAKIRALPAGRIGDPEDLGKAAVFFSSDDSEWVTGALLAVDGGALVM